MIKLIRIIVVTVIMAFLAGKSADIKGAGWGMVSSIAAGVVSATTASLYEFVDTHGQGLKIWFQSKFLHRNHSLYLSFSYLYRIELDGKYLLIKGNRLKDRYQPIGGVYKYYSEAKPALEKIDYKPDSSVVNNAETDDLRIRIQGKNLLEFYDWFLSMKDREYDPTREFYEEVIKTKLLPEDKFRNFKYRKVLVHNVGVTKSIVRDRGYEVIYADIFELNLDDEQKRIIRESVMKNPDLLCLVTAEEIRHRQREGHAEMDIANNSPWLLNEV